MKFSNNIAQKLYIVKSFEEADTDYEKLQLKSRLEATQLARNENVKDQEKLNYRANYLLNVLEENDINAIGLKNATKINIKYLLVIWIPLLIFGMILNEIGPDKQINLG